VRAAAAFQGRPGRRDWPAEDRSVLRAAQPAWVTAAGLRREARPEPLRPEVQESGMDASNMELEDYNGQPVSE
jgi:hypothetical protein